MATQCLIHCSSLVPVPVSLPGVGTSNQSMIIDDGGGGRVADRIGPQGSESSHHYRGLMENQMVLCGPKGRNRIYYVGLASDDLL